MSIQFEPTSKTGEPAEISPLPSWKNEPLLRVEDLKAYFFMDEGTVKAVDGVSFDVFPGKVVGIVGESGCGKSVTMKAILQILEGSAKIVSGKVTLRSRINNQDPNSPEELLELTQLHSNSRQMRKIRGAEIALIPQEPMAAFSPVHTVGSQIMETILLHQDVSKKEARQITVEVFKAVGISMPEQRIDSYSWQLSGGLRQRAIIAMALSCNPRLLIADEPTTAIDVTTQAQILKLLRKLQEERQTSIIFITHDLGVIAQMADEVVVMYLGMVMEKGSVQKIYKNAQHPYTQALLRSIPSVQSASHVKLPTIAGSIAHPFNRPSGCPFHPRCTFFMRGVCDASQPALVRVEEDHFVNCFLFTENSSAPAEISVQVPPPMEKSL
ncbi:MAG: dipeptide/oligopeptide/nickel ABC transporter ATP-binding protein [Chloroflexi bacterium HGW-Chloroflexi-10]|nr:MAG: dipeptide/oligopeptide/nickel ABC transporter ATP-binding protein [Chloroflexi bacterium HGW-Chloroflexi-10]